MLEFVEVVSDDGILVRADCHQRDERGSWKSKTRIERQLVTCFPCREQNGATAAYQGFPSPER
jgi:hypothetical protein